MICVIYLLLNNVHTNPYAAQYLYFFIFSIFQQKYLYKICFIYTYNDLQMHSRDKFKSYIFRFHKFISS